MRVRRYRVDGSLILNPGVIARHQITWQKKVVTGQNSAGEDIFDWTNVVTMHVQMEALAGRELEQAQQYWAEARYTWTQHRYAGLGSAMRVSWWIDGIVRLLNVLNISDPPGVGLYQTVIAKDYEE